jgi:hypothetical protein
MSAIDLPKLLTTGHAVIEALKLEVVFTSWKPVFELYNRRDPRESSAAMERPSQGSVTQMAKGHLGGPLEFRPRGTIRRLDG